MYIVHICLYRNPRFSFCISKSCYEGVISEALHEYILERWVGGRVLGKHSSNKGAEYRTCIIRQKGKDNIEHRGRRKVCWGCYPDQMFFIQYIFLFNLRLLPARGIMFGKILKSPLQMSSFYDVNNLCIHTKALNF
jgi:hypothetical protein